MGIGCSPGRAMGWSQDVCQEAGEGRMRTEGRGSPRECLSLPEQ